MFTQRSIAPAIALLSILYVMFYLAGPAQAQPTDPLIYWVYDAGRADSQFGYTQGDASGVIGQSFLDHDLEGITCMDGAVYASSGGDGKVPSRLYQFDPATGALTEVGVIATGPDPYYEVASLAEKDGKLWGYAAEGKVRGILQIDPVTAQAVLVYSPDETVDVSSVAWLDGALYLGARAAVYSWAPGGDITHLYSTTLEQIEAMDARDGLLYLAGDGQVQIQVYAPDGTYMGHHIGAVPEDIESLAFCSRAEPTSTPTATASDTPTPAGTPTAVDTPTATATEATTSTPTETPVATTTPTSTTTATPPPAAPATATPPPAAPATATPQSPTADGETAEPRRFVIYVDLDENGGQGAGDPFAPAGTECYAVRTDAGGSTRLVSVGENGSLTLIGLDVNAPYELGCESRLAHPFNTDANSAASTLLGMAPIKLWMAVAGR